MASERHDGDRQDSAAGLRYLLKYSHRKCTLCGFVMKDDGEWPECPYDKGHMKPYAPEYHDATTASTGAKTRPAERWTIISRRKLSERLYWAWALLFRWPKAPPNTPTGPAGDAGQVGWMGGEFDR